MARFLRRLLIDPFVRHNHRSRSVGRLIGVVLTVMLVATSVVADTPAHATTTGDDDPQVRYELVVSKPKRVCVGADVKIDVSVVRFVSPPHAPLLAKAGTPAHMAYVVVESAIQDKNVLSSDSSAEITGLDNSQPPQAVFTFHAKKAGISNVDFTAKLAAMTETDPDLFKGPLGDKKAMSTVTVVNCKFNLTVFSSGPGVLGLINKAEIEFGSDGHFKNSLFVSWTSTIKVGSPCGTANLTIKSSTADLVATLDQQGSVTIDLDYKTVPGTVMGTCYGISGSTPNPAEPADLHLEVGFHGGSGTLPQALAGLSTGILKASYLVAPIDEDGK